MISHITTVYLVLLSASSATATDPATRDAPIAAGQCSPGDAPCKEAKLDSLEMSIYCEALSGHFSDLSLASLLRDPRVIGDIDPKLGECERRCSPHCRALDPNHYYGYEIVVRILLRDLANGRSTCSRVLLRLADALWEGVYGEYMEDEAEHFLVNNAERLPALWGALSPLYQRLGTLETSLQCSDLADLKAKVTRACASPRAPKDQCSALFKYFRRVEVDCAENDPVPVVDAGASLPVDSDATKRPASQSPEPSMRTVIR